MEEFRDGLKPVAKAKIKQVAGIFIYMRPYLGYFTSGMFFLVLSSLTAMLFPYLLGLLIGQDKPQGVQLPFSLDLAQTSDILIALMCVFTAQAIFSFLRIFLFARVTEGTLRDIRSSAFKQLISAPISFFHANKVGELTSRIATDVNQLQNTINTTLAEFIMQVITIVIGVAALTLLSWKLALIMLSVIPLVSISAVFFGRFIRKLSKRAQDSAAASNQVLEEALSGIAIVKAFTNEAYELTRYRKELANIRALSITGAIWRGAFASFIILCMFGSVVFIIWQGVLLTQSGALAQSSFIAFIMYTIFLGASISSLPELYAGIQKAAGATENLLQIIATPSERVSLNEAKTQRALPNGARLTLKNVCFSYPQRAGMQVLHNLSFEAKSGEFIAIVGPSGAGKSTLASLLLRFHEPTSGSIELNGQPIAAMPLSEYRSLLGVVPQEVVLFGGTIRENIASGQLGASEQDIADAARKANAWEFISRFEQGLDTVVGERGVQLSGGQRQRIAIARAILRDPAILILDEATSSLDSESERLVQDALQKLMQNRTSFVIAHRLSTVQRADRILVLEDGKLREEGRHLELITLQNGLYKRLHEMQQLAS